MVKNIILIGMKACGKSTVGKLLAKRLDVNFIELDQEIEKDYLMEKKPTFVPLSGTTVGKEKLTFREIFKKYGENYFRQLESRVLENISKKKITGRIVLSCGGGTPLNENNQKIIKELGEVIFLDVDKMVLLPRILKHGIPAFFPYKDNPEKSLGELIEKRKPIYEKIADKIITFDNESPKELVEKIISFFHVIPVKTGIQIK